MVVVYCSLMLFVAVCCCSLLVVFVGWLVVTCALFCCRCCWLFVCCCCWCWLLLFLADVGVVCVVARYCCSLSMFAVDVGYCSLWLFLGC